MKRPLAFIMDKRHLFGVLFSILIFTLFVGCVEINGGAVEAGWDLRFPDGRSVDDDGNFIDCQQAGLANVFFSVISVDSDKKPCEGASHCLFPCSHAGTGITDFAIPPGVYSISLQLLDQAGKVVGPEQGVVAPSPVVRVITNGKITDLNVNLIIVDR
jgi:hypothetical protein